MQPEHRLLIIDDNPSIHEDFRKILSPRAPEMNELDEFESAIFGTPVTKQEAKQEMFYSLSTASQGEEGFHLVQDAAAKGCPFSMAFVDMRMPPGWDGVETVTHIWQADPSIQIVICTAYSDYSWDEMRRRLGGSDRLVILKKPFDNVEVLQLAASLTKKWELNKQAELRLEEMERRVRDRTAQLRQSEERFATAFRAAPLPQAILHLERKTIVDANEAFSALTGFSKEELRLLGANFAKTAGIEDAFAEMHPLNRREAQILSKTGQKVHALLHTQPTQIEGATHLLLMAQDVTKHRALEDQLRQSQKMEAVGQLAAGVAHDFNNILTVIQAHLSAELASNTFPESTRQALTETLQASERAAVLTRQLLTFSRRHLFQPQALNLNSLLEQETSLLRRVLGEHIQLLWNAPATLPFVRGDAATIEQAVLNLAINARDAMEKGGELKITAEPVEISERNRGTNPDARTGQFVRLQIADTGHGMDKETLKRIFEPFFTTKDVGKGTGMGLATVYGIAKQHEGWIDVVSAPGKGTAFSMYLPVCEGEDEELGQGKPRLQSNAKVCLRVLLVEDEPAVRSVMKLLLTRCGCQVVEAADARRGYEIWSKYKDEIDLLVTDIVMPGGVSGHDLARQILSERPELKVIYCSGYSADLFKEKSELVPGQNFLQKPYDASSVVKMLIQVAEDRRVA